LDATPLQLILFKHSRAGSVTRWQAHLTHLLLSSLAEESISLINEQQQAAAAALCPVKHVMQLGDGLAPKGRNITPTHDGIVQSRSFG